MFHLSFYRRYFSRVMGSPCRAVLTARVDSSRATFAAIFFLASLSASDSFAQILLPPPPAAVPPPVIPPEKDRGVLERNERIETRSKQIQSEEIKVREAKKIEAAIKNQEELAKPRPLYGFLELSLLYARVSASGERKDYYADPTTHISGWFRLNQSRDTNHVQIWAGFRVAPFAGYGTQKQETGRFNFMFVGPGLAIGMLSPHEQISNKPVEAASRSGWLLAAGASGLSKSAIDRSDHEDDFSNLPLGFEAPGIWSEVRYMRTFHSVLSTNLIIGSQLAKQKNFYYIGFGLGGWM